MFRVLTLSNDIGLMDRLTQALQGTAGVMRAEPAIETLNELLVSLRPDLLIVDFTVYPEDFNTAIAIARALQGIAPASPILAIGDAGNADVVLGAIRAGARDFLPAGAASEAIRSQIVTLYDRTVRQALGSLGQMVLITSGQPNDGEGLFAVNYAVLQAQQGGDVILLDFHLPTSVAGPALDLGLNYTIRDGVHDMPRMDRTLLSTVLCRHQASGLHVLPLALGASDAMDVAARDILELVKLLRGLFSTIVVNLAGLHNADLLQTLLADSQRCYLVTSQCFTSVKACRDLLAGVPAAEARVTLVIDEYDPAIVLTDTQIKNALGLARVVQLPRARAALLNAANKGVPLVTDQPKSPYARALTALAGIAREPRIGAIWRRWGRSLRRRVPAEIHKASTPARIGPSSSAMTGPVS
jgi:pilus assembly protein CpaE